MELLAAVRGELDRYSQQLGKGHRFELTVACPAGPQKYEKLNIGGMGLGSFNDRMRDSVMGGSPFATPKYQGLITGLSTQPNWFMQVQSGPPKTVLNNVLLQKGRTCTGCTRHAA